MNLRALTLDLLLGWEADEKYINLTLSRVTEQLEEGDRRYVTALLYGTVERLLTLDYYIGKLTRGRTLTPHARGILRLGLYELLYLSTPRHATVNEAVKLATHPGEASFINGVLRSAIREEANLVPPPREKNLVRHLSVKYSVPQPTVKRLYQSLGDGVEDYLAAINAPRGITLCVNTTKVSRQAYLELLSERGISAVATSLTEGGVILEESHPPKALPGFDAGWFYVQDEASQAAVTALAPKGGSVVYDLCAAPGGKTFGAAIAMGNTGKVLSFDLHASKLSLIREGAARLGLDCVTVGEQDATKPDPALYGGADYVICDVPCSGLGVLSKKADLRYKDLDGVSDLPALQRQILEQAALCLAPGGTLVYSTCTVVEEENQGVTDGFLNAHPDFCYLPFDLGERKVEAGHVTLYPHTDATDGFYIAKIGRCPK